ncbi:MAG: hypothetical protein ACLFTI_01440 [Anaerolineales bacterium]
MNSHEYDVEALDELFRRALQSERQARPPRCVWRRVLEDLGFVSSRLRQNVMAFFHLVGAMDPLIMTTRPMQTGMVEFFQVSPFVGAIFNQVLDLRMMA